MPNLIYKKLTSMEEIEMDPERIQLRYHKNDYISKSHSYLRESVLWKSPSSYGFWQICRQQKIIYSFVMEREKNYNNVGKYILDLPNVGRTKEEISITSKMENLMG